MLVSPCVPGVIIMAPPSELARDEEISVPTVVVLSHVPRVTDPAAPAAIGALRVVEVVEVSRVVGVAEVLA